MRTKSLTEEARVLARELLRRHEQICHQLGVRQPKDVTDGMVNQCIIFYGVLCDRAGVPFLTHGVGQFLGEIAEWCDEHGWPPLNALAVNAEEWMPGDGYDEAAGCALISWADAVKKCIAFRRYPASTSI
jgi:hypothetical protein